MAAAAKGAPEVIDRGIPLDELTRHVPPHETGGDGYLARIGEGLINRVLDGLVAGNLGGPRSDPLNGNPVGTLKDLTGMAKDMADIDDTRLRRLQDALEEERKANAKLREDLEDLRRGRSDGSMDMFKMLLSLMDKSEDRMERLLSEMRAEQKEWRDRQDGGGGPNNTRDFLAQLGLERLNQSLHTDPLEVAEQLEERIAKRLERHQLHDERVIDLEKWKTQQNIELEKQKIQAEREDRKEQAQARTEQLRELRGVLSEIRGAGGPGAPVDAGGEVPGLYRYACAKCEREFALREQPADGRLSCPHCQAELLIGAAAS